MSQPSPSSCSVFVQVYVDTNAAQEDSTKGVYMVDNRLTSGSRNEGQPSLDTHVSKGSANCFQALNIDATSNTAVSFESFGDSNAWGTQVPAPWQNDATQWTALAAEEGGDQPYSLIIQVGSATPFQIKVDQTTLTIS